MEISIRTAVPADAGALRSIYAYYVEKTAVTFDYEVPSEEEFRAQIVKTLEQYPFIVAEKDKEIAGYACTGAFKGRAAYGWAAETTVYLRHGESGNGIGRQLYEALEKLSAAQNIRNLYACIGTTEAEDEYLTNRSAEFHAHLGYRLIGTFRKCGYKFGRWYDMVWMEKMIGDHPAQAGAVIPFPALPAEALHQAGL